MRHLTSAVARLAVVPLLAGIAACSSWVGEPAGPAADSAPSIPVSDTYFPDVVAATAIQGASGTWTVSATLSSPYDTPDRYADAWRILDDRGNELGRRELGHDHQNEQPFTRSLSGVEIPAEVLAVTVQGRDQLSGWGGATTELTLSR